MEYELIHNEAASRFEIQIEGLVCEIDYTRSGNTLNITHTGVPKALEGRGIAGAMTKQMLDYVRKNGLKIRPICPYTATYVSRHPEYNDLVDAG